MIFKTDSLNTASGDFLFFLEGREFQPFLVACILRIYEIHENS